MVTLNEWLARIRDQLQVEGLGALGQAHGAVQHRRSPALRNLLPVALCRSTDATVTVDGSNRAASSVRVASAATHHTCVLGLRR